MGWDRELAQFDGKSASSGGGRVEGILGEGVASAVQECKSTYVPLLATYY